MSQTDNHEHDQSIEDAEIIYLQDEDGEEIALEVIMRFEVDQTGHKYILVLPADDEEADEVIPYRYEEDEDGIQLIEIEDPEEWSIVEETWNTLINEDEANG
jgi:uncharacterized protein YrzB (UPF0473 family)